jgi:hypothetical protein
MAGQHRSRGRVIKKEDTLVSSADIAKLIESYGPDLMELDKVVGIGESLCNGEPCIRIYLSEADHTTLNEIPTELNGITVIKEISGPLNASGAGG